MPDMMYGEKERKIMMKEKKDVVVEPQASKLRRLAPCAKTRNQNGCLESVPVTVSEVYESDGDFSKLFFGFSEEGLGGASHFLSILRQQQSINKKQSCR